MSELRQPSSRTFESRWFDMFVFLVLLGSLAVPVYSYSVGFTRAQKIDALFHRCHWRGGQEITRAVLPGPVDFECFVNGKLVDRYSTTA